MARASSGAKLKINATNAAAMKLASTLAKRHEIGHQCGRLGTLAESQLSRGYLQPPRLVLLRCQWRYRRRRTAAGKDGIRSGSGGGSSSSTRVSTFRQTDVTTHDG